MPGQKEPQSSRLDGLGKGEQRVPGCCCGSELPSSGLDGSEKEERRGLMQMQKGPPSSGLDSPGKETQRGPGPCRGSGSDQYPMVV